MKPRAQHRAVMATMTQTNQETDMKQTNENASQVEAQDVIVLGVASIETKGGVGDTETVGIRALPGISEE